MATLRDGTFLPAETGKKLFLAKFAELGNISQACRAMGGLTIRTVYHWKRNDPDFAKLFEEAKEISIILLEDEAFRRAVTGVRKPVYQGGKKVGEITEYSDTLLAILLRGALPNKYKTNVSTELSGPNGQPINSEAKVLHVHSAIPLASSEDDIYDELEPPALKIENKQEGDDISGL